MGLLGSIPQGIASLFGRKSNSLPWSLSQNGDYPSGGGALGKIRSNPGGFFDNLASHLGQAGAYWSGDWDTGAAIGNGRAQTMQLGAKRMAEQQQTEATRAAMMRMGYTPDQIQAIMAGSINPSDLKKKDPAEWEDNAGNRWRNGPDGAPEKAPYWVDTVPKYQYVPDGMGGMQPIVIPNPFGGTLPTPNAGGSQQPNLVGKPFAQLPQSPQSAAPTIRNTPPPRLGSNGLPAVLTPEQYQATVNAMGKAQTDEWMRRNGIRIGQ